MEMKTLPIIAAIVLYFPVALNAIPNGDKHWSSSHIKRSGSSGRHVGKGGRESNETTRVFSGEGSEEHSTTTETFSKSSSSTTLIGGEAFGGSKENLRIGSRDYICDCTDCVQHTYELTDEDLNFVDISVITTIYTDVQILNCGTVLTQLTKDYDQLSKKVKSVDSIISMLTKEKNSVVSDLENCRHKYALITIDFVNMTDEVKIVKRTLQDTLDDSAKLKTKWIAATADAQVWKTKSDGFEIDLKRAMDNNGQLTSTVNEYSTTIANLRSTVNDITIKNTKCGNDSNEWKRKWEAESAKVTMDEKRIKELEGTNDDLTSRITKLTNDLSSCRSVNKQNDIEIGKLKDTVTDLTKQSSKCTVDLGSCNVVLNRVTDEFNADKLQDVEAAKLRSKLELQLGECVNRKKDIEQNLESERKAVDKCKGELVTTRNDCSKRYQKYEDDITELKENNKNSIDKCDASLKSERENSARGRAETISLKNRITDLETKLAVSTKNSDDWQKKSQFCEDDSLNLKQKIDSLQTNVADVNKHLSNCVTNGNSLQSDLTSCKSKQDVCTADLEGTKKRLVSSELIIGNLNTSIGSLETAKKGCQTELSKLRCDVDQHLKNAKSAQEKAYDAALQVVSALDANKKLLGSFADSHDVACRI